MIRPNNCTIDVTEGCNLACDYCFTHSRHNKRDMDPEMFKKIVDWWMPQTKENETVSLTWWGGEPLLKYQLIKDVFLPYARDKADELGRKLIFGGTTNGVLYTPDKIEWLFENKSGMIISIDGVEEAHDKHRVFPDGSGSWKVVDKNLREAKKIRPEQRVRFSVAADTVHLFYDTVCYLLEDVGIDDMAFSPVYEGDWNEETLEIYKEQLKMTVDRMIKEQLSGGKLILKHVNDEAICIEVPKETNFNPCGAGNNYFGWSVDGFGYPCHRFNKHGVSTEERYKQKHTIIRPKGNSFEWCHEDWIEDFVTFREKISEECKNCELLLTSGCNGGCYAVNWDITGDIFKPPKSVCEVAKVLNEIGAYYFVECKKHRLEVPEAGWHGSSLRKRKDQNKNFEFPKGCLCYNGCYNEGTDSEIIHIDRKNDKSCMCYNAMYMGEPGDSFRTVKELDKQREAERRIIEASRQVIKSAKSKNED